MTIKKFFLAVDRLVNKYALLGTEMEGARLALEKLDIKECVQILTQIFEIVDLIQILQ